MSDSAPLRRLLAEAFHEAVRGVELAAQVERALPPRPPKGGRVVLVAAGKAAPAMARGAARRWPHALDAALLVTTDGTPADLDSPRAEVLRAGHPLPDERGVAAALRALQLASSLGRRDLLLCLISGGASALLALPPEGFTLERKRDLVARLLDAGAPIEEVNTVRRHLSRIKGGRLALAASPARTLTLLASDVLGGAPHDVGSGPTVPDPTTVDDAAACLERWLGAQARREHEPHLSESLKPGRPAPRTRARVVADPALLADEVARRLGARGFLARVTPPLGGDARAVVGEHVRRARALLPGEALVSPSEPLLPLPATRGAGGRAGWTALLALLALPDGVALLCGASDGVDGSGGLAGACVARDLADPAARGRIASALSRFDDAPLHRALGSALETGPTGLNLVDVHVLARAPTAAGGVHSPRAAAAAVDVPGGETSSAGG